MKFRLNYHVSDKTTLEHGIVLQNIQLHLNYKKYDIISIADNIIKFKTNPWELRWHHSPTKLDGGEFELNTSNGCTKVTLNYYDNILLTLVLVIGLMISLISDDVYEPLPFFIGFFIIAGLIHIMTLKNKAKELLRNILQDMEPDI